MNKQIRKIAIDTDLQGAIASLGIELLTEGLRPGDLVVIGASTVTKTYRLSHGLSLNPYTKRIPREPTSFVSPVCICEEASEGEHECPAVDAEACTIQPSWF